jgi:hypothetical protein
MDSSKPAPSDAKTDEDKLKDIASEFNAGPTEESGKPVDTTPSDVDLPGTPSDDSPADSAVPSGDDATVAVNDAKPEDVAHIDATDKTPNDALASAEEGAGTSGLDTSTPVDAAASPTPVDATSGSPAAAPDPAVMGMEAATGGKSKKKGMLMGLIIGAAVLVLGGGGAAAYFGYVVPNKPENVLKAALANSFSNEVTSEYFEGSASLTDKESDETFTATFLGKGNNAGAMEVSAEADVEVAKFTFDMRSVDGTSLYLKIGGLDGLPELLTASGESEAALYAPIIDKVNDQWYEVSQNLLKQLGYDPSAKLSQEDQDKLAKVYQEHQFLKLKEKLDDETIKGMDSYHFRVVLDKAELVGFVQGVSDANISALKSSKEQIKQLKTALSDLLTLTSTRSICGLPRTKR